MLPLTLNGNVGGTISDLSKNIQVEVFAPITYFPVQVANQLTVIPWGINNILPRIQGMIARVTRGEVIQ